MSDSDLVEDLFVSLSAFLSTEWTAKRQPYRLLESVRAASSAPDHDTSRIFLESSFKAWLAYFVVKPTTANAVGQVARRQQFAALDRLSNSERRNLAARVNDVSPHPTVATLITMMEREARAINPAVASLVPSKRPRTEQDDFALSSSSAYPSPGHSQVLTDISLATIESARRMNPTVDNLIHAWNPRRPWSRHPRRRVCADDALSTGQLDSPTTSSSLDPSQHSSQLFADISRATTDSNSSPEPETLGGPDIAELDLFPEYLAGAIKRLDTAPKTAAVTIQFPVNSIADVNCAMFIEVLPNKVERLASLLFNAHLETNGNVRELILPGGLCVIPTQLQGSPPESVTKVFGATTAAALESAPYRKVEVSEAGPRAATRCVTMTQCSDSKKGAIISVALGRREASKIYEKLFKSSKSKFRSP